MSRTLLLSVLIAGCGLAQGENLNDPPSSGSIELTLTNTTEQTVYVPVDHNCVSGPSWVSLRDAGPNGEPVVQRLVCPQVCGEELVACAAACAAPSMRPVAPGESVTTQWDGLEWINETNCQKRAGAGAGPFEAQFCWSDVGITDGDGFRRAEPTLQCGTKVFRLGLNETVTFEVE